MMTVTAKQQIAIAALMSRNMDCIFVLPMFETGVDNVHVLFFCQVPGEKVIQTWFSAIPTTISSKVAQNIYWRIQALNRTGKSEPEGR